MFVNFQRIIAEIWSLYFLANSVPSVKFSRKGKDAVPSNKHFSKKQK